MSKPLPTKCIVSSVYVLEEHLGGRWKTICSSQIESSIYAELYQLMQSNPNKSYRVLTTTRKEEIYGHQRIA